MSISRLLSLGSWIVITSLMFAGGCSKPPGDNVASKNRDDASAPAGISVTVKSAELPVATEGVWRGLRRYELPLDQKLLVVKGSKGLIGCPYLNIDSFEKFGEACAIIPAVDTAGMLESKVTAVTTKARELGLEVGMSGREALDKIR